MGNLYIYGFLVLIIVSLTGGFYFFYRSSEAEKAALIQQNAALTITTKTQEQTITDLQKKAELIMKSNAEMANDLAKAEEQAAQTKKEIDDTDYTKFSDDEQEKKVNEAYHNSLSNFNFNSAR